MQSFGQGNSANFMGGNTSNKAAHQVSSQSKTSASGSHPTKWHQNVEDIIKRSTSNQRHDGEYGATE